MKKAIKYLLNKLPYISDLNKQNILYKKNACFAPGHYYSPIISVDEVKENQIKIWKGIDENTIEGVDLNEDNQIDLLSKLEFFYPLLPFQESKTKKLRYYYDNEYYRYSDAFFLFGMIHYLKPKKIIEVGSGFSSALMLDTNTLFFENKIALHFIEPYPERLQSLMTDSDKKQVKIIVKKIQEVPLDFFGTLENGDILFIDSSHVSKCGSDLNYILFEILPVLNKGVFIHFHDIFYPFEYPKQWVFDGRNWNENYILRAFLMYNKSFKIKLFSHYLHLHQAQYLKNMPITANDFGGSIWLKKE